MITRQNRSITGATIDATTMAMVTMMAISTIMTMMMIMMMVMKAMMLIPSNDMITMAIAMSMPINSYDNGSNDDFVDDVASGYVVNYNDIYI